MWTCGHARLPRTRCDHLTSSSLRGLRMYTICTIAIFLAVLFRKVLHELGGCLEMATEPILAVLDAAEVQRRQRPCSFQRLSDYCRLTKPEVNFLIAVTTAAGFLDGCTCFACTLPWTSLLHALCGPY